MITIRQKGDFSRTKKYLSKASKGINMKKLEKYAIEGVNALKSNTPIDTGLTADSWYYTIENKDGRAKISFCNSNIQDGVPIAIIIQYGHVTGNGDWVEGVDYINPSLQPVFDKIAKKAWKEVS
ncbi:MAG: HK97 gp10 family phage protein [Anaeroplasma sp.]